jgi:membrane protease YdiL (CAAX protease family)
MSNLNEPSKPSNSTVIRFWQRIPLLIRAVVIGFLVFEIGVVAWVVIVAPLVPAPWSIFVMGGLLWIYWKYFSGNWWPESTIKTRQIYFRDVKLSGSVWKWGIVSALCFVTITQAGFVVTFRFIEFPAETFAEEYYFNAMPIWLAWLFIIMSSLVAGICEEVGLRGYLQVPLEKRYGPMTAILIVSIIFLVIHLHQAWAIPILFHVMVISALLGILAYASESLIPSILGHTVMDVFNFSYWWSDVAGTFDRQPITDTGIDNHIILWVLILAASIFAFYWSVRKTFQARNVQLTPPPVRSPG